jgi:hypothetical protein
MPYYKFDRNQVLYNQTEAYPPQQFWIYNLNVYYNTTMPGASSRGAYIADGRRNPSEPVNCVPNGYISLYEMNIDRPAADRIYSFITKQGSRQSFKTISTTKFNTDFAFGDEISSSYPLSASISRGYYAAGAYGTNNINLDALKTTFDQYRSISPHYNISSSVLGRDLDNHALNVINIPSIFYGTSIKKGSVSLKFYQTGSLIAHAKDDVGNGNLIDVHAGSSASGSVVGVVLYNEGFIFLTSSTVITAEVTDNYNGSATTPQWLYYGDYGDEKIPYVGATYDTSDSSYLLEFSGTTRTPVMTMFACAPKNALNNSSNLTFLSNTEVAATGGFVSGSATGSTLYHEPAISVANVGSSSFYRATASFERTTYISSVKIYDESQNCIGIAKLASPVKKSNFDDYTFKLQIDL